MSFFIWLWSNHLDYFKKEPETKACNGYNSFGNMMPRVEVRNETERKESQYQDPLSDQSLALASGYSISWGALRSRRDVTLNNLSGESQKHQSIVSHIFFPIVSSQGTTLPGCLCWDPSHFLLVSIPGAQKNTLGLKEFSCVLDWSEIFQNFPTWIWS